MKLEIGKEVLLASGYIAQVQGFDGFLVCVANFKEGFSIKVPAESLEPVSKAMQPWPVWEKGQEVYSRFLGYGEVLGHGGKERVYVQFNNSIGAPVFIRSTHLTEKPEGSAEVDDLWMNDIDF
jgi:hypothetical protein